MTSRKVSKFPYLNQNESVGTFYIIAMLLFLMGAIGIIWPLIKLLLCSLLSIRCIDDETGEMIYIPWAGIGIFVAVGAICYLIDWIKHYKKI